MRYINGPIQVIPVVVGKRHIFELHFDGFEIMRISDPIKIKAFVASVEKAWNRIPSTEKEETK